MKHKNTEKMLNTDWKALVMYILPVSVSKDPQSSYTTTIAIQERLSTLPQHWSTYVKVPNLDQNSESL